MPKLVSFPPVAVCLLLFAACGACKHQTAEVDRPSESYNHMAPTAPSLLHIPVHVTRGALVEVVNAQLPAVLIDEADFGGYGVEMKVARAGRLELAFRQNPNVAGESPRLFYEVPLRIAIRKNALITTLKADGELTIKFSTALGLKPTWEVTSRTELLGYQWTRQPQLNVGGLSIPIEGLTSKIIERAKREIAAGIDKGIQDNVSLRPALEATLAGLSQPQVLSADFGGYLMAQPSSIGMAALTEREGGIGTVLQVELRPRLGLGIAPTSVKTPRLPANTGVTDAKERFDLSIQSLLAFGDIEQVLAKAMVDTTLSQSGRSATIREVDVYGQGVRLVIGLRMTGDYTGWAYLRARPVFDADSERMELRDVDVTLDTKNLLYRTIGVLFRGRITKALDQQIGDQVAAQLEAARSGIADQLNGAEVIPGVRLRGTADKVRVSEALVTEEGLTAEINFTGSLGVVLERIPVE